MNTSKKLIILVPQGRYRELLSSLTLPVAVVRLCNWVQRALPNVECHVIEGAVAYGHPIDEAGEKKTHAALFAELDELVDDSTLFGFSAFANREIVHALPMAREIKRRYGTPILLGGYAASTDPEYMVRTFHEYFDGVVASAGEFAVVELLKSMDGQNLGDLSRIPNLVYWDGSEVRSNPKKQSPRLEHLPPLDLSVLHHASSYEQLPYFATAGCPFSCDFCYESMVYPEYDKNRVDLVLRDLDAHMGSTIRTPFVSFVDPLFGADKTRTLPLLKALRERDIRYTLYTRADILDEESFKLMEGQCRLMFIGLEAVTESSLVYMNKTNNVSLYMQRMHKTMALCFKYGITPQVGVIPNYPLNKRTDVEAIKGYFDDLRGLHDDIDPGGPGFLVTVFGFHIWPGLAHYRELEMLEAMGLTWRSGFADEYHGERVPASLRRDVLSASEDYTADLFAADRFQLYGKAHQTADTNAHVAHYVIGYSNSTEGRHVRVDGKPFRWLDKDQNIFDIRGMYAERIAALAKPDRGGEAPGSSVGR